MANTVEPRQEVRAGARERQGDRSSGSRGRPRNVRSFWTAAMSRSLRAAVVTAPPGSRAARRARAGHVRGFLHGASAVLALLRRGRNESGNPVRDLRHDRLGHAHALLRPVRIARSISSAVRAIEASAAASSSKKPSDQSEPSVSSRSSALMIKRLRLMRSARARRSTASSKGLGRCTLVAIVCSRVYSRFGERQGLRGPARDPSRCLGSCRPANPTAWPGETTMPSATLPNGRAASSLAAAEVVP